MLAPLQPQASTTTTMPEAAPASPPVQTAPLPSSKLPKEGAKAYACFQAYCKLGPGRSLTRAARELDRNRQHLGEWSVKWHWQERVAVYDAEQAEVDRLASAQAALERARLREERRDQLTETMWNLGEKLTKKLTEMLNFPTHKKVTEKRPDGTTIIINPAKWDFGTAARIATTLKEVAAFSVGVPSTITAHTDREGEPLPSGLIGADGALVIPEVRISIVHTTKEGVSVKQPAPGIAPGAPVMAGNAPVVPAAAPIKKTFTFERSGGQK